MASVTVSGESMEPVWWVGPAVRAVGPDRQAIRVLPRKYGSSTSGTSIPPSARW